DLIGQNRAQIADDEPIVIALRVGTGDHCGGKVNADEPSGEGTKYLAGKPGAAAQIEQRFKTHRPAQALKPSLHGIQKERGAAIVKILSQRGVVRAAILIDQPPYIRLGHGRLSRTGAEPLQLQPRAVIVSRVGAACRTERRHCAVAIAEPLADGAKREPGGGEARRGLDGLHPNIHGGDKIAASGELDRGLVTAVADEVAGRYKQRAGFGHETLAPGSIMIIYDIPAAFPNF